MIAYKWVIEKDGIFYPLVNFQINPWMKDVCFDPYEIGNTYIYKGDKNPYHKNDQNEFAGFHLWINKENTQTFERWNNYLKGLGQPTINSILTCHVDEEDVFHRGAHQGFKIITYKFKVINAESLNQYCYN